MASIWRRTMVYLGLVDDEEYEEYEPYDEPQTQQMAPTPPPRRAARAVPDPMEGAYDPEPSGVRTLPRDEGFNIEPRGMEPRVAEPHRAVADAVAAGCRRALDHAVRLERRQQPPGGAAVDAAPVGELCDGRRGLGRRDRRQEIECAVDRLHRLCRASGTTDPFCGTSGCSQRELLDTGSRTLLASSHDSRRLFV